jgi:pyruvate-formate lyase
MNMRSQGKILQELKTIPENKLEEILAIIRKYGENAKKPSRKPVKVTMSDLCGAISAKDAKLMEEAIKDCERIDSNGW